MNILLILVLPLKIADFVEEEPLLYANLPLLSLPVFGFFFLNFFGVDMSNFVTESSLGPLSGVSSCSSEFPP